MPNNRELYRVECPDGQLLADLPTVAAALTRAAYADQVHSADVCDGPHRVWRVKVWEQVNRDQS